MFAAVLRNNDAAKTIGARTGGDGCGFVDNRGLVILPHSGLRFRVPNCVRLRADGSGRSRGSRKSGFSCPSADRREWQGAGPSTRANAHGRPVSTTLNPPSTTNSISCITHLAGRMVSIRVREVQVNLNIRAQLERKTEQDVQNAWTK